MPARVARVLTELSLNREFDYAIPESFAADVRVGSVVRMPFGRRHGARGFVTALLDESPYGQLRPLEGVESEAPLFDERMVRLTKWLASYYAAPFERALAAAIPAPVRRAGAGFARQWTVFPGAEFPDDVELARLERRAPRQAAALRWLAENAAAAKTGATAADLGEAVGVSLPALRALAKRGWVRLSEEIRWRGLEHRFLPTKPLPLTGEQQAAFDAVCAEIDAPSPGVVLLHGVTGSGKTEVYLQAIAKVLAQGRGAIALVPEIALTPQTMERFIGRFGETVAVLHSHLSDGERYDEWQRIAQGRARVVVGARSALFAPVRDLGLLLVDEEHEPAYKQEELPRYHARDVAVMRGHLEGCAVILGSATPSMESYRNALAGKYRLVEMPHRVDGCVMPNVRVVDMRAETAKEEGFRIFSKDLEEAVRLRLSQGEQTMLFLNRRGYATTVMCPECGHVEECDDCSVKMTYHRHAGVLMCHVCGKVRPAPERCPVESCGSPAIKMSGVGTQRVEAAVRRLFPEARVARMDSDTTGGKESHAQILGRFRRGEVDILIGTQMIAKGLDFPNVTLVGVIAADMSLQMPDFRAAERTFQLLTQVSGRAGRGDVPGDVYIQTFAPFSPAIQCARNSDYRSFFDQELWFRKEMDYPPFSRLSVVRFTGEDEAQVNAAARACADAVAKMPLPAGVRVQGPAPAALAKAKKQYRVQLLFWGPAIRDTSPVIRAALAAASVPSAVVVSLDIDAISVM